MKNLLRLLFLAVLVAAAARVEVAAQNTPFAAKTETIRGTISSVNAQDNLVILKSPDGVPYDFQVRKTTAIEVGSNKLKLEDLANQTGKEATVTFRALRTGNVALKIEVQ